MPLIAHFLEKHGKRFGRSACTISPEAIALLRRHTWPGNVRELENAIERALVLGRDDVIWPHDLPDTLHGAPAPAAGRGGREAGPLSLAAMEREHIVRTLRAADGNKAAAARLLGIDRKTLYRKLEEYGIDLP